MAMYLKCCYLLVGYSPLVPMELATDKRLWFVLLKTVVHTDCIHQALSIFLFGMVSSLRSIFFNLSSETLTCNLKQAKITIVNMLMIIIILCISHCYNTTFSSREKWKLLLWNDWPFIIIKLIELIAKMYI